MQNVNYTPIGIIYSSFRKPSEAPIQPSAGRGEKGKVEVFPEYSEGLQDLETFSHIILIYHFHLSGQHALKVRPFLDDWQRGLFATRAPARPNPIGISTVHLLKLKNNILHVENMDIIDGTPLLDIKPYVPEFDHQTKTKIGWLEENLMKLPGKMGDDRFCE